MAGFPWFFQRNKMVRKKEKMHLPFFIVILFIIGSSFFIWNTFNVPSGDQKMTSIIHVEETPMVRLGESRNFVENQEIKELYEGESIQTKLKGITLEFFEKSLMTLDANTTIDIVRVRERSKDSSSDIKVSISHGRMWISVPEKRNPHSKFQVEGQHFSFSTRGGEFFIDGSTVTAVKGDGTISIGTVFTRDIEVGQQLAFLEKDFLRIANGQEGPQKQRIPSRFQDSQWFLKNVSKTKENISLPLNKKGENTQTTEVLFEEPIQEEEEGDPPLSILSPGENGSTVSILDDMVTISGTVPVETQKVIVNEYTLSKFEAGDLTFSYNAAEKWGTLTEGKNKYTIVALGKDGKRHEATIYIVYTPTSKEGEEIVPKEGEEKTEPVGGNITILSPKEGDILKEDVIIVRGEAPKNAEKIVVNDYTLTLFSKGDIYWTYKMSQTLKNREIGPQTLIAKALDAQNNIISEQSIEIIIKSEEKSQEKNENKKEKENDEPHSKTQNEILPPVKQDDFGGPTI
jgi:hypothetical protein